MGRYLAIDIGKEKGRHILGRLTEGKLVTEEIYSFDNKTCERDGELCWDFDYLFGEVRKGLAICFEAGKLPIFVAVTAWDGDFVLLDGENKVIGIPAAKRDEKTDTITLLKEIGEKHPEYLEEAECFLFIPDYFNFLLTGARRSEYFKALAADLADPMIKDWDEELIQTLGLPRHIFMKMNEPAGVLGTLRLEINEEIKYDCIILQSLSEAAGADLFDIPEILEKVNREKEDAKKQNIEEENIEEENSEKESIDKVNTEKEDVEAENPRRKEPPVTAAIANLLLHMICSHELKNFQAARECLYNTLKDE